MSQQEEIWASLAIYLLVSCVAKMKRGEDILHLHWDTSSAAEHMVQEQQVDMHAGFAFLNVPGRIPALCKSCTFMCLYSFPE